jgi:hypothetical protein
MPLFVVMMVTCGPVPGDGNWHAWYAGWAEGMVMPRQGEFHQENMASMDYAIYRAGQLGTWNIFLVIFVTPGYKRYLKADS